MRVLVSGGRDWEEEGPIHDELNLLALKYRWITVIEGGALGADRIAQQWAMDNFQGLVTVRADWKSWGYSAGPVRNAVMLAKAMPDYALLFPSQKRGMLRTGTGDMLARLQAAGVPHKIIEAKQRG